MKHSRTRYKALLGLMIPLMAIAGWWFFTSRPAPVSPAQITEQVVMPEPSDEAFATEEMGSFADEESDADPFLFEAEHAPLPKSSPADTDAANRSFSPEELAYRAEFETQLEQAIAGNDSQAMELSRFINECSAQFSSTSTIKRSIDLANRRFAEGKSLPKSYAGWPGQSLENIEAFEQFQWQAFQRCESSRDLFAEDFWQRLRREADGGNPAARYLYATLQRIPVSGLRFDQWAEALEHNERVYRYTVRNMSEREPLGILAMAQTLPSGSRSPYNRFNTVAVLTTAAIKCGLQSDYLDQQLDDWINHFERMQQHFPDALSQLNEASEEVRRMFCK